MRWNRPTRQGWRRGQAVTGGRRGNDLIAQGVEALLARYERTYLADCLPIFAKIKSHLIARLLVQELAAKLVEGVELPMSFRLVGETCEDTAPALLDDTLRGVFWVRLIVKLQLCSTFPTKTIAYDAIVIHYSLANIIFS